MYRRILTTIILLVAIIPFAQANQNFPSGESNRLHLECFAEQRNAVTTWFSAKMEVVIDWEGNAGTGMLQFIETEYRQNPASPYHQVGNRVKKVRVAVTVQDDGFTQLIRMKNHNRNSDLKIRWKSVFSEDPTESYLILEGKTYRFENGCNKVEGREEYDNGRAALAF